MASNWQLPHFPSLAGSSLILIPSYEENWIFCDESANGKIAMHAIG